MKIRNITISLFLMVLGASFCSAQGRYTFTTFSQSYHDLEDAIVLNDASYPYFHDEMMIEVDFPIFYFGKKIYSVLVKNRGEIIMGNQEERIELFPVKLKLNADSKISYKVEGGDNCGNQILKIEYQKMGFQCDPSDQYFATAQLWIHENTGVIEMHFGSSFDNPAVYNMDNCYGKFTYGSRLKFTPQWSAMPYGDANAPNFTQGNIRLTDLKGIASIPSSGLVYRFDPEIFSGNNFKISPNPARYFTTVYRPSDCGAFQINIFNTQGQLLIQNPFINPSHTINTSNLVPGMYFVQILNTENHTKFIQKLLIL